MKPSTLETLVWVLIYGGLLVLCLGLFIPVDGALRVVLWVLGALAVAAGVAGIVWRSRMGGR